LNRQIQIIKPEFIITLGNYSTAYIFSEAHVPYTSITAVHGKVHEANLHGMRTAVFPTFHPAAALYSAKYKEQIARDFQLLKVKLEKKK
jgi:DNA polymerase